MKLDDIFRQKMSVIEAQEWLTNSK